MSRANLVILSQNPPDAPAHRVSRSFRNVDLRLATPWMQGFNAAEQQAPCGTLATIQVCPASGTTRTIESPAPDPVPLSLG